MALGVIYGAGRAVGIGWGLLGDVVDGCATAHPPGPINSAHAPLPRLHLGAVLCNGTEATPRSACSTKGGLGFDGHVDSSHTQFQCYDFIMVMSAAQFPACHAQPASLQLGSAHRAVHPDLLVARTQPCHQLRIMQLQGHQLPMIQPSPKREHTRWLVAPVALTAALSVHDLYNVTEGSSECNSSATSCGHPHS